MYASSSESNELLGNGGIEGVNSSIELKVVVCVDLRAGYSLSRQENGGFLYRKYTISVVRVKVLRVVCISRLCRVAVKPEKFSFCVHGGIGWH